MHLFQAGLVKCAKESVIRKIFGNFFVKRELWKKHRICPSDIKTRWDYRECANKLRAKCRQMVLQEEQEVVFTRNSGSFYRYRQVAFP